MAVAEGFQWVDAIPWVLVIAGWLLVNKQHNSRESRKELRAKLDQFRKMVDEVEDAAVEHHTTTQTPVRCMKIKRTISRLSKELNLIAIAGLPVDRPGYRVTRVRQAVTLKNFDSQRYVSLATSDPIIAEIGAAADDLRYTVEKAYTTKFYGKKN